MRSIKTALITGTLVFTLTSLAYAGPRIVTPRVPPPTDGALLATAVTGPFDLVLFPNQSSGFSTTDNDARHCVVEVTKGGKRNARVSLVAIDSNAEAIAAVNGQ